MRLNNAGDSLDDGTSTTAVDFLSFGTERGESSSQSLPAPLEFRFSIPRHIRFSTEPRRISLFDDAIAMN